MNLNQQAVSELQDQLTKNYMSETNGENAAIKLVN